MSLAQNAKVSMRKTALVWLLAACSVTVGAASDANAAAGPTYVSQGSQPGTSDAFFGYSVAVDGDTALIGAFNDGGKGAAYVFVRSAGTWSLQQRLAASDGAAGDEFGYAVALSGDTAVVSAVTKASSQGYVYVFARSGTAWTQQQEFTGSDSTANDCFGCSVSVSGAIAIAGAPQRLGVTGAAYVFANSGGVWQQQQEFLGQASGDAFGFSVALGANATTAVIGAYGASTETGKVYALTMNGTWASAPQQVILTASDGQAHDRFGYSVSAGSGTLLVGAYQNAGRGAAYVFTGGGAAWTQQTKLVAADGAANDFFGYSVALNGNTAVAGAYEKSGSLGPGAAYVFTNTGGTWTQQEVLASGSGQYFGYSVAASGTTAVVGAFGASSDSGDAYFFASSVVAPALGRRENLVALTLLLAAFGSIAGRRNRRLEAQ
jgi:hypothetical protein